MTPLRALLYFLAGYTTVRVADAIADALEGPPTPPSQAARRVELLQRQEALEAELQGVRLVLELPAEDDAGELPALPFGPSKEPAKA
jgi:hypothetical protein